MNLRNLSSTKKEKHHTLCTILLCENMILTNIPTSPSSHNQHPPTFPRSGQHQISLPILNFRENNGSYGVFPRYPTIISSKYSLCCYNLTSPLISHRIRYSGKSLASQLSSFFRRYTREEYISEPLRGFISTL